MNSAQIIQNTISFVKETLKGAEGGHDFFHVERVYRNALSIAKDENVDSFVVSLGALLHDIADAKFYNGDESIGPKMARAFLESQHVEEDIIVHIENIIQYISFKTSFSFFRNTRTMCLLSVLSKTICCVSVVISAL